MVSVSYTVHRPDLDMNISIPVYRQRYESRAVPRELCITGVSFSGNDFLL